jgi:leucyl aminopeptidase
MQVNGRVKITLSNAEPSKANLDALLVICPESPRGATPWSTLNPALSRLCSEIDPHKRFRGKEGAIVTVPTLGRIRPRMLALVGTGSSPDVSACRRSVGAAIRQLQKRQVRSFGLLFLEKPSSLDWVALAAEEATYHFREYSPSTEEPPPTVSELVLFLRWAPVRELNEGAAVAASLAYARRLANQPGNLFGPARMANEARQLARRRRLRCTIWQEARLKREGFGGILAVGQGSRQPPHFIRLDYRGGNPRQAPIVVVGKAITFDTGGISIKPSDKMDEMKFDKCGGVAVLGILDAVAALRLPLNVTGLISAAENMPSGSAYRPGDLVRNLSGKYIEIINTDAEGRVVLSDALVYAQRLKPRAIVDMATLTGACIICFGHECAAVLGNNQALIDELKAASERSAEKVWQLPIWPVYQEKVKSDIGFVKNSAGREAATITGACFLNAFVEKNVPWAHIDIAGMAWTSKEEAHRAKGATGFGIGIITNWLRSLARK